MIAITISLSCSYKAEAKKCGKAPIKIAVIDTGFGYKDAGHDAHLCKFGHKDFSMDRQFTGAYDVKVPLPLDVHGHGTNVVGIIESYLNKTNVNYCIVIIKYYSEQQTGEQNLVASTRAFNYAANIKVDYVNYSGGGPEANMFERASINKILKYGGHFIAAAGNEGQDLDNPLNAYYPASYDKRIIVVGNLCSDGVQYKKKDGTELKRCGSSNYGESVTRWEPGENITAYGITMTGTSQATAAATGKIASESSNRCDIGF